MWKQVLGVHATLVNEEYRVFLQNREQKVLTQVFRAGWISDYADAYSFLELFRTDHVFNDYGYSNPMYDALLDEIAAERIPPRRRRLMSRTRGRVRPQTEEQLDLFQRRGAGRQRSKLWEELRVNLCEPLTELPPNEVPKRF